TDGGDDDDNDDDSDDDDDDSDEEEDPSKEEEEHSALADSSDVAATDSIPLAGDTEAFEKDESAATPPPPAYRVTAKMSVRHQTPTSFPSDTEVERLLALPTPPPSPLSPWSSPLLQISSPPLP
ncbi:hypothetical protein Tco_0483291, partial [Tanacetum coccineum]